MHSNLPEMRTTRPLKDSPMMKKWMKSVCKMLEICLVSVEERLMLERRSELLIYKIIQNDTHGTILQPYGYDT